MMRFSRLLLPALPLVAALACAGRTESTGSGKGPIAGDACTVPGAKTTAADGCSTCECTGGKWACDDATCATCSPGETPAASGCEPCIDGARAASPDGCNTCTCAAGQWGCTAADCRPQCTEGDTQNDGCNSCSCHDGNWVCTDRYCPPEECTDGETRAQDCNTCTCMNGQWGCTTKACPPPEPGKGCGARLGDTCSSDEYCAYEPGSMCGAADASATCKKRPSACDLVYAPVCGCDGKTYDNACSAASSGTGVSQNGPCPSF